MVARSGPDHVPVNLSARRALALGLTMTGICSPAGIGSSNSNALKLSLENRLQALSDWTGPTLYKLQWKRRITSAGLSIPALRASVHSTSGKGSTLQPKISDLPMVGWATPTAAFQMGDPEKHLERKIRAAVAKNPQITDLSMQAAALAGWPTPMAGTPAQNGNNAAGNNDSLRKTIDVVTQMSQPIRLTATGETLIGSSAGMESGGQLDPAHSRWLMRVPPAWDACAPTETPSTLRKRQLSSARTWIATWAEPEPSPVIFSSGGCRD
jgi:hypothetical protein